MAFCIVDLQGEATVAAASRYFSAAGYTVMPADTRLGASDYVSASLVCVDAGRLAALQLGPSGSRKSTVIAAASFGDAESERLIESGAADAVLSKPLLRSDLEDLLTRIVTGQPLLAARDTGKQSAAPQFTGLMVLVADDNAVNREVAIEALSRMGAAVSTVENGAQAIAAVREGAFDLVLMDGSMPEVDGFTAAREIRTIENEEGRNPVPIVALTAHVVGTSADAWRDAGMNDVLYKPYTLAQLAACFQRLFPDWASKKPSTAADIPAADAIASNASDTGRSELLDPRIARELEEIAGPASKQFLQRIFGLYLDNAPRGRDEMVRAFEAGDHDGCARAAHALKSMSHNVGAVKVADAAEHIERWCREKDGMPEAQTIADFVVLLDSTLAEVATRVDAPTASRDRLSA
jgi:CheY-like chemotaxis protein/HPt (histidine-containing phosphotransfer) domain-containing protein